MYEIAGQFDLHDSRKRGWTITIELVGKDSTDGTSRAVLELDANNPYFPPHYGRAPADIRWIREPDSWNEWRWHQGVRSGPKSRKYDMVLGVLPVPDAPMELLSPVISPGTYLVLGDQAGKPIRVLDAPVSTVAVSYTDFGG